MQDAALKEKIESSVFKSNHQTKILNVRDTSSIRKAVFLKKQNDLFYNYWHANILYIDVFFSLSGAFKNFVSTKSVFNRGKCIKLPR